MPLFAGLTPLQLREFLLDSISARRAGRGVFPRNDYTNTFFTILDGTVAIEVDPEDREHGRLGPASSSARWA
jgi:hypothetical protein